MLCLCASTMMAGGRAGWTKVFTEDLDPLTGISLASIAVTNGAEEIGTYGARRLVSVPLGKLESFLNDCHANAIATEHRDDFNLLQLPGGVIDSRVGIPSALQEEAVTDYPVSTGEGLYVIQFTGPAFDEWLTAVEETGAQLIQYVPQNAYIIGATKEEFAATRVLPFLQWADLYQSYSKGNSVAGDGVQAVSIRIAAIAGHEATINYIKSLAETGSVYRSKIYSDVYIRVALDVSVLPVLLRDAHVLGIYREPNDQMSDERQSLSIASSGYQNGTRPVSGVHYGDWLASFGSAYTSLGSTWRVGMFDTGVDNKAFLSTRPSHPELAGRMVWGKNFHTTSNDDGTKGDEYGHGSLVAGILVASAATGKIDNLEYYNGVGVAPSAYVVSTKSGNDGGIRTTADILEDRRFTKPIHPYGWAHDAYYHGAYIQNHSHNDYSQSGIYTDESRRFDIAVRDTNAILDDGNTAMTLTVSGGNINQSGTTNPQMVAPPATGKNVIAIGGAENFRKFMTSCHGEAADSFNNIMSNSKRGTIATGVIKPDLVAPSTSIVSLRTQHFSCASTELDGWCESRFGGTSSDPYCYHMRDSGTSFSAPVGAGAALLASKKFSDFLGTTPQPSKASPALLKAMLVGGAINLTGYDRVNGSATVPARPSIVQGFGRINLDKVLSTTPSRMYVNQSKVVTRTQPFIYSFTYTIDDPTKVVRVVLAWTDAPGEPLVTYPLVNDLDLKVELDSCLHYRGNAMSSADASILGDCSSSPARDTKNNVELVAFTKTSGGTFTVDVEPVTLNGVAIPNGTNQINQDFALYIYNAR